MFTKKTRIPVLCLLVIMLATSVAQAAPMTSNEALMPQGSNTGARAAVEVAEGYSPTTGLPSDKPYRPVLVQICNAVTARPNWSISEADVVYEMIYWGPAYTRYTAVYNDNHPSYVGAVRSARTMQATIREEWDAPFVYWGGQLDQGTSIKEFFNSNKTNRELLFDGAAGTGKGNIAAISHRETARQAPDNVVVDLQKLVSDYWPKNENGTPYEPKVHAFNFSSTAPSTSSNTAQEIHIQYDKNHYPSYTYNATDRVYERWYTGTEHIDGTTGKRVVAANVIVQFADLTFHQNIKSRPEISFINGGVMDAFIDGKHIRGTWERNSMSERTVFMDAAGNELVLLPGKTFIQVVPTGMEYTYMTAEGTEMTMGSGKDGPLVIFDPNESEEDINKMDEGVVG